MLSRTHAASNTNHLRARNFGVWPLFGGQIEHDGCAQGKNIDAKQALIEARALQTEVIDMCRELQNDRLDDERSLAAEISFKLGQYLEERDGNANDAVTAYNDCL